ncbi:hypothetical protein PTTG_03962 [Puccinia triticina 1-1 BBBD Race 1]|uniref:Uncharacterized protein n=1 Tax=Puccinia triticina (isolate 1-1 / race 1 (BBBD)) TaxID=630390 RepID=A0A0C4ET33_PUCT1|nr:hypothetical protein PTTG_03962 [Puccinia triticina 1-1 BBBD Race 1]
MRGGGWRSGAGTSGGGGCPGWLSGAAGGSGGVGGGGAGGWPCWAWWGCRWGGERAICMRGWPPAEAYPAHAYPGLPRPQALPGSAKPARRAPAGLAHSPLWAGKALHNIGARPSTRLDNQGADHSSPRYLPDKLFPSAITRHEPSAQHALDPACAAALHLSSSYLPLQP